MKGGMPAARRGVGRSGREVSASAAQGSRHPRFLERFVSRCSEDESTFANSRRTVRCAIQPLKFTMYGFPLLAARMRMPQPPSGGPTRRARNATSGGSPRSCPALLAASSRARRSSSSALVAPSRSSSASSGATRRDRSVPRTDRRPASRTVTACSTTAWASRRSSIRPAPSRPSRASATSDGSNPAQRSRSSISRRLLARTVSSRRARSRAVPRGRRSSRAVPRGRRSSPASPASPSPALRLSTRTPSPSPSGARCSGRGSGREALLVAAKPLPRSAGWHPGGLLLLRPALRGGRVLDSGHVDHLVAVGGERRQPHGLADPALDVGGHLGVLRQELAGVLPSLPELLALIGEPRARLLDDLGVHPHL